MYEYDFIIVGAGIAGLYAAYKIMKEDRNKNKRILVLERETSIGGRADNVPFYGSMIATGAGIGRKKKDHLLLKLMREMGMPIREFESGFTHSPLLDGCNVKSIFSQLKKGTTEGKPSRNSLNLYWVPRHINYSLPVQVIATMKMKTHMMCYIIMGLKTILLDLLHSVFLGMN